MGERCSRVLGEVHLTIGELVPRLIGQREEMPRLLDVGCWDGRATLRYAASIGARAAGVEIVATKAAEARTSGVEVAEIDLESDSFPWPDGTFDIVVANQVLEHVKNVWRPLSEIRRVIRPNGVLLASVPNLASLHNRVLLAAGLQPTSIRTLGPHVRGFTFSEFRNLIGLDRAFEVQSALGVGFYPLPPRLARVAARIWPSGSHTVIVVARTGPGHSSWLSRTAANASQTQWGR